MKLKVVLLYRTLHFLIILFSIFFVACNGGEKGIQESLQKALGVKPISKLPAAKSSGQQSISPTDEDLLSQKNSITNCPEDSSLFGKAYPKGLAQWCAYKDKQGIEVKHGEYRQWHRTGSLKASAIYQDGELENKYSEWYEDKRPKEVTLYSKGRRHGKSLIYSKEGRPLIEANYINDELHGPYLKFSRIGKPLEKGTYVKGQRMGVWEIFDNSGSLKEKTEFQNNFKHGKTVQYNRNGQIQAKGFFDRDQEIGHWIYFNNKGFKSSEGNLIQGKKHGRWVDFGQNGEEVRVSFFDLGRRLDSYKVASHSLGGSQAFGSRDILGAEPPRPQRKQTSNNQSTSNKVERPKPLTKEGWAPL